MEKVGLVMGSVTPSARAAPRTKVVLPDPSSPVTSTTSPSRRRRARSAPSASVSAGSEVARAGTVLMSLAPRHTANAAVTQARGLKKRRPARERESEPAATAWEGWRREAYRRSRANPLSLGPPMRTYGHRSEEPELIHLDRAAAGGGRRHVIGRLDLGDLEHLRLLGRLHRQQLGPPREVLAQRLEHARRVERRGGMEDRIQPHRTRAERKRLRLPVRPRDPGGSSAQELRREVPERTDDLGLNQLDLPVEVFAAV